MEERQANHIAIFVPRAVLVPSLLSVVAVGGAFLDTWWWLASLPFIWLGSICAAPNLNLVNGCLAYVAIAVGFGVTAYFRPLGLAILGGACGGYFLSSIEKGVRERPVDPKDF